MYCVKALVGLKSHCPYALLVGGTGFSPYSSKADWEITFPVCTVGGRDWVFTLLHESWLGNHIPHMHCWWEGLGFHPTPAKLTGKSHSPYALLVGGTGFSPYSSKADWEITFPTCTVGGRDWVFTLLHESWLGNHIARMHCWWEGLGFHLTPAKLTGKSHSPYELLVGGTGFSPYSSKADWEITFPVCTVGGRDWVFTLLQQSWLGNHIACMHCWWEGLGFHPTPAKLTGKSHSPYALLVGGTGFSPYSSKADWEITFPTCTVGGRDWVFTLLQQSWLGNHIACMHCWWERLGFHPTPAKLTGKSHSPYALLVGGTGFHPTPAKLTGKSHSPYALLVGGTGFSPYSSKADWEITFPICTVGGR